MTRIHDDQAAVEMTEAPPSQNPVSAPGPTELICTEPWTTIFVTRTGDVRTCCASQAIFGNLAESSIEDIWNNEKYMSYRQHLAQGSPPPECLNCLKNGQARHIIPEITYILSQFPTTESQDFWKRMRLFVKRWI